MFSDPVHVQRRLDLIEGYAKSSSLNQILPIGIPELCMQFEGSAIHWSIKHDILEYLLSDNANFSHETMQIGSFVFNLGLRNENGNIIFSIIPDRSSEICPYYIYCELYCIETGTQYKRTHLFSRLNRMRLSCIEWSHHQMILLPIQNAIKHTNCEWSDSHLSVKQCENKQKLTFCAFIKILDESECECRNYLSSSLNGNIYYEWNLERYYTIHSNKHCKIYSPNFGDDCWCLWYKYSQKYPDSIIFGLQLLKLPPTHQKGVMFKAKVNYQHHGNRDIEFVYFLDLKHSQVEIARIAKVSWLKIQIISE